MKGYKGMMEPNKDMKSIIDTINGIARKNILIFLMVWGSIGWLIGIWYMISLVEDLYNWV